MSKFAGMVSKNLLDLNEKAKINDMVSSMLVNLKKEKSTTKTFDKSAFASCVRKDENILELNIEEITYVVMFDGKLTNINEIKNYIKFKYSIKDNISICELIGLLYHILGNSFLKKLNGEFAISIWCKNNNELLLARDRFGTKPLYYIIIDDTIYFGSEIKALLKNKKIMPEVDINGIKHIFGLGPNIGQEYTIFKNIYPLLPASIATYNNYGFNSYKYWNLTSKKHLDSEEETIEKVYSLTKNSIEKQISSENNLCYFLSGGLDSSIITAIGANYTSNRINTFSVDYSGNSEFFKPNEFQPNTDLEYIKIMSDTFDTSHEVIYISPVDLIDNLENAVIAREHPGLADIDSSLFCFTKEIGKNFDYALSGECADEIFGGYPWFHKKDFFETNTFPWSRDIEIRQNILNKNLISSKDLEKFIEDKYNYSIREVPCFADDNDEEKRKREISYLNIKWFMHSLGERSEKIGTNVGLNIKMPFCNYKLIEYVWNIPWKIKNIDNREKGLLRRCFKDDLPEKIFTRKKSPYPKTHNPEFENLVKEKLLNILNSSNCKIKNLIDLKYLNFLMENESDYGKPWFGQLMATPQLYAYLIQIEYWLDYFKVKII